LNKPNSACSDWTNATSDFRTKTADWANIDANLSASQWTPEQRASYEDVVPVMQAAADTLERIGRTSNNPIFEDIAMLAAQYRRAFAQSISTYTAADGHLYDVSLHSTGIILGACDALAE
jgi:hypothetical protein